MYASANMYPTMKMGQRHELVSRRTIATVDIHWQASRKKIITDNPTGGAQKPDARPALLVFSLLNLGLTVRISAHRLGIFPRPEERMVKTQERLGVKVEVPRDCEYTSALVRYFWD